MRGIKINRISWHVYLADKVIFSHNDPENSAITSGKLKMFYVVKNGYPISIIQLDEVSDISWNKKAGSIC